MMKPVIIGVGLFALFIASSFAPLAAADSAYQLGGGGQVTLEDQLKLARERVAAVQANPHAGSGTPYLSANGVIGATIISGAIFGGIFVAFVFRAKQIEKARKQK